MSPSCTPHIFQSWKVTAPPRPPAKPPTDVLGIPCPQSSGTNPLYMFAFLKCKINAFNMMSFSSSKTVIKCDSVSRNQWILYMYMQVFGLFERRM